MKAIVFQAPHQPVTVQTVPRPQAGPDQVVVELAAASLNRRDWWMTQGLYPKLQPGVILGSCGAGRVNGRAVVINPNIDWGINPAYPNYNTYRILGMPDHGTFAEAIAVHPDRLVDQPPHLTPAEAATLPLAGLTAHRALFNKGRASGSTKVLVNGVGGGVALLAAQFAIAIGAEVMVTSSSDEKIARAIALGARGGMNYKEEGWGRKFTRQFGRVDVVIDSAGGEGFGELLTVCRPQARIVCYGGSRGASTFKPQPLFFKEIEIVGSTMGSDDEFNRMIELVNIHQIRPVVDAVFPLAEAPAAFDRLEQGVQFGKIVLEN